MNNNETLHRSESSKELPQSSKELLQSAHAQLCRRILDILNNPEATTADLKLVKDFLKDNHIEALDVPGSPLGQVADAARQKPQLQTVDPDGIVLPLRFPQEGDLLTEDDPAVPDRPVVILGNGRKLA